MNDEATCHYIDMIDQTTMGHRFIKQQFNTTPRAAWQIDPFGHSSVQAYLLGAEVLLINRTLFLFLQSKQNLVFFLILCVWWVRTVRVGFSAFRENRLPRQRKAKDREIPRSHLERIKNFGFFFSDLHQCLSCSLRPSHWLSL